MKINLRAGLLVILLAAPAFLFLFLLFFGENQFALSYKFPVAIEIDGETQTIGTAKAEEYSDFLIKNSERSSAGNDTLYLKFASVKTDWTLPQIQVVYDYLNDDSPDENQLAELNRIAQKVENLDGIRLLYLYGNQRDSIYFDQFYGYLSEYYPETYNKGGMIFLIDRKRFFRGVYNPEVKSDIDRLITEYQILLNN